MFMFNNTKKEEELKTLKDIKGLDCDCCSPNMDSHRHNIKQEAIKWVKFHNTEQGEGRYSDEWIDAMNSWIKAFFNISEEDLE